MKSFSFSSCFDYWSSSVNLLTGCRSTWWTRRSAQLIFTKHRIKRDWITDCVCVTAGDLGSGAKGEKGDTGDRGERPNIHWRVHSFLTLRSFFAIEQTWWFWRAADVEINDTSHLTAVSEIKLWCCVTSDPSPCVLTAGYKGDAGILGPQGNWKSCMLPR